MLFLFTFLIEWYDLFTADEGESRIHPHDVSSSVVSGKAGQHDRDKGRRAGAKTPSSQPAPAPTERRIDPSAAYQPTYYIGGHNGEKMCV